MTSKLRIAVFLDYSLRTPAFNSTYQIFKAGLFSDKQNEFAGDEETTGEVNFYWKEQLKNANIENFYVKKDVKLTDYELKKSDFKEYFYNEEHWMKFIEDYSFNLYGDAEVPYKKDVDLLNIVQTHLFDVIIVDEFFTTRKKSNTFYYLSKIRVFPQAVLFLGPGAKINESTYFGIWNPKSNSAQENQEGLGEFENWLKNLEVEWKEKYLVYEEKEKTI